MIFALKTGLYELQGNKKGSLPAARSAYGKAKSVECADGTDINSCSIFLIT